jgi:hypothetical protein
MYFPDLQLLSQIGTRTCIAIGWLDRDHPFPTAIPDERLLDRLFDLCLDPPGAYGGAFQCPFCVDPPYMISESRNGKKIVLGNTDIYAVGLDGCVYCAPGLIYHYIAVHHYAPPAEFVAAVIAMNPRRQHVILDEFIAESERQRSTQAHP